VLPTTGLVATGSGFFVNDTDVVTAAHVVEDCGELRLEDGSALSVLAADRVLDLAVLASSRRSSHWLPLGPATGPRLGEPVLALGYPLFGDVLTVDQGLSVTGGHISSLPVPWFRGPGSASLPRSSPATRAGRSSATREPSWAS
jgi:S1-C subfamily serine protease